MSTKENSHPDLLKFIIKKSRKDILQNTMDLSPYLHQRRVGGCTAYPEEIYTEITFPRRDQHCTEEMVSLAFKVPGGSRLEFWKTFPDRPALDVCFPLLGWFN